MRSCRTPAVGRRMTATDTTGCVRRHAPNFDGFGSVADIFEAFFGGGTGGFGGGFGGGGGRTGGPTQGARHRRDGRDRPARGGSRHAREVDTRRSPPATDCRGNGAEPGTPIETCSRCGGSGQLRIVSRTPFGQVMRATACDHCGGDGRVAKNPCSVCHGRGRRPSRSGSRSTFRPASRAASGSGSPAAATPVSAAAPPATCTC